MLTDILRDGGFIIIKHDPQTGNFYASIYLKGDHVPLSSFMTDRLEQITGLAYTPPEAT